MSQSNQLNKYCLIFSLISLIIAAIALVIGYEKIWQPFLVLFSVCLAIGIGYWPTLKSYQFTVWIIAGFIAAMVYASDLIIWGGFNITNKWIVLFIVQAVMFSMGTEITIKDFADVIKMPWGVFVGTFCHFLIMPLLGFTLTKLFDFPPEIAVGIILIGSCSSGLSSTVMCYIAKANLALAVSIAAVSTLAATIMTPLWVSILGGSLINVKFTSMMMDVIKIVLIPIGAAMLCDYLKSYATEQARKILRILAIICSLWLLYMCFGGWNSLFAPMSENSQLLGNVFNFITGAIVWSIIFDLLTTKFGKIYKIMPKISMFGIIFFTTTAAAAGRDNLMQVGGLLCLAMLLHNLGGFSIGYVMSRFVFRLDTESSRTVAFEVGLQNGGMASGLAAAMGKLATVGLASAIMTPIGNVTGSLLANYWRSKPIKPVNKQSKIANTESVKN